ncbi:MAG: hypothetical protein NC115_00795 [Bacteroidales bacterium]|nr:hypothetical protein [Bacteroidales bacterium]
MAFGATGNCGILFLKKSDAISRIMTNLRSFWPELDALDASLRNYGETDKTK